MVHETTKHIHSYSIPADLVTSLKSTVIVYSKLSAKPEVATAAESTIHNSFMHNELTFRKSPSVQFILTHIAFMTCKISTVEI